MAWFRVHEGTYADAKWPVIARKANTNVGTVVSIWVALLDHASQHEQRGSLEGFDPEAIDALYGYEDGTCQGVFDAMVCKGLIADGRLANWEKRQPIKEDATARERKARYNERHGTPGNVPERSGTPENAPDKIRIEEIKENLNTPPLPPKGGGDMGSLPEPDMEFTQLRAMWDEHMRPEGSRAGFKAYLALKKARAWPGIAAIEQDVLTRKEAAAWSPGYEPGLDKYLTDRTWQAQMPRPTPQAAPSEWQQRRQDSREMAKMILRQESKNGRHRIAAAIGQG